MTSARSFALSVALRFARSLRMSSGFSRTSRMSSTSAPCGRGYLYVVWRPGVSWGTACFSRVIVTDDRSEQTHALPNLSPARKCGPAFNSPRQTEEVSEGPLCHRTLLIHSAFAAVFAVMAVFAIATASGTTSAWFSPAVSSQAYAASLIGAVVVAIALATTAVSHLGRLEDARRGIALRIPGMPEADLLPAR